MTVAMREGQLTLGAASGDPLVPIGADPHAFEPSLADRGRLDDAELVVANGLGLEEGAQRPRGPQRSFIQRYA